MFRSFSVVPPQMFVAASDRLAGDPIAARIVEAEDGSIEVPWFVDATERICHLASSELSGAPDVCMPNQFALQPEDVYAAPDCTEPIVPIPPCLSAPFAILRPRRSLCRPAVPGLDLFAAGAPHPTAAMSFSRLSLRTVNYWLMYGTRKMEKAFG
jgi:hypothetical protein